MSHLLSVAYHYVLDDALPGFRGLKGVPAETFASQLDLLATRYAFIGLDDFLDEPWRDGTPRCLITFDDGTKDHRAVAAPILQARGIPGVFFVTTSVLDGGGWIPAHLLHQLLAVVPVPELAAHANAIAERDGMQERIDLARPQNYYPYDDQPTGSLKFHLHHLFPFDVSRHLIEQLFLERIGSIEAFRASFYLDAADVSAMEQAGHTVASHAHEHQNLATVPRAVMEADVEASAAAMDRLGLTRGRAHFAVPYGGDGTFDDAVLQTLARNGFHHVHVARREVNHVAGPIVYRYSTKQLPPFVTDWP